jgi:hypothetical protein
VRLVVALVAVVGLGAVAATLLVGSRVFEEKVTPHPFEEGLRWDERQRRAAGADCAISAGPCERGVPGSDLRITLEIEPRPVRAMADLAFAVGARRGEEPLPAAEVELSLSMPGMYMGDHRVPLAPAGPGRWRGPGVFVRCPSGGRTWSAEVVLRPPGQAPLRATFTFDLAP